MKNNIEVIIISKYYSINEFSKILEKSVQTIVDKEGNELFRIDINKGLKTARKSSDKEVLDLLNNTLNDDESYEDINNNINVSVSINNSAIAAYVEGINTIFECINNNIDIDISTLRESIKKDIADNVVNYININIE